MTGEILGNLESNKTDTEVVDALSEIWQGVLQRPNIGPQDDFNDLGGNDALTDKMFAEIAQVFGRQLPSATICHAPTIAALAALIQRPDLPPFSPFVKLKAGTTKTPVFIAHGLDGRASYSELARHICTDHAIYGIQAKGVDGLEEPFDRIEDMASSYLAALHQHQPEGPCILIGYSFGGLVALEMAQRLLSDGKQLALLILVDAYPHPRYLSPGQRLRLMLRRTRRHTSEMAERPPRDAISYFLRGLARRLHLVGVRNRDMQALTSRLSFAQTTRHVQERAYVAYRRYRPRFYPGRIKFVKAGVGSYFPDDPAAVWGKLTGEFECETVPGGHLEIVTTEFEGLAAVLTGCLQAGNFRARNLQVRNLRGALAKNEAGQFEPTSRLSSDSIPSRCSVNPEPAPPVIETLLRIWQRVLGRSSIRPTDNFFDLGGTPSSASMLFAEIGEAFGRDFPAVMICVALTLERLAALLEDPAPPPVPPLVLLRSGYGAPVFIAHGLGGTVLGLSDLVGKMETRNPIYGMQARGIDGIDEPLTSIEAMAQYHLDAIKQLQPHGPYFLIGYSLGGLVTLEMAQRLSADGEKVALLALVDAYPHKRYLSVAQYLRRLVRRATRDAWSLIASPPKASNGREFDVVARVTQRMREADCLALRGYHPRFFRGTIRFVKAEISSDFPEKPAAVWSHLAEKFEVETVPGDHVGMIATHFKELAAVLSRYLAEAGS